MNAPYESALAELCESGFTALLPAAQAKYPPIAEPGKAEAARMIGDEADLDRKAVRSSKIRSVLPGTGIGMTDESMTASPKSPTGPRPISQRMNCEEDRAPVTDVLDEESSNAFHNATPHPATGLF